MKTVLVTGATGYIGSSLVPALRQAGFEVIPHSSSSGDIARCTLPIEGVDHVVHLAGRTFVPASWERPLEYYEVNVLGTLNVLEHCRRSGASLLFLSSYAYGHPEWLPTGEDHPVSAANPYGHSKLLAEDACRFYEKQFSVTATIVRLFNVYGPGQPSEFLIPSLIRQLLDPETKEIVVLDDTPRRDYIHLNDCINLFVRMIQDPRSGTYNAGSGVSHSVREIVTILNTLVSAPKVLRSRGERRRNEIPETRSDNRKVREVFGWEPATAFSDGLASQVRLAGSVSCSSPSLPIK